MWIEARLLQSGFSVFIWDNEVVTRPEQIGTVNERYSWKVFAKFLMNLEGGFIVTDNLTRINVEGEEGLVADCLRMAWSYHELGSELLEWFLTTGDDEFNFINFHFNVLAGITNADTDILHIDRSSDYQVILNLVDLLKIKVESNFLNLLEIYGLKPKKKSILKLIEILEDERQQQIKKKNEIKLKMLVPFANRIEELVILFDNKRRRIGAGISGSRPTDQAIVRYWLENYVVERGYMPEGMHEVSMPFLGGQLKVGDIDFSKLTGR
jgi:hypothetical protein